MAERYDATTHVALSADSVHMPGVLALISSVLSNSRQPAQIHVHIFVNAHSRAKFERAVGCSGSATTGATVDVHPVDKGRFRLTSIGGDNVFAERLRIYLPELLPPTVSSVLWLDADALMVGDAVELMKRVFRGGHKTCGVAVVPREMKKIRSSTGLSEGGLRKLGLTRVSEQDSVWNAGLMAINLDQWRARGTQRAVESLALRRKTVLGFSGFAGMTPKSDTQTPLVLLFANGSSGCLQELPSTWMVEGLGWKHVPRQRICEARLLHWSGKHKPWNEGSANYHQALWLPHYSVPCAEPLSGTVGHRRSNQSLATFCGRAREGLDLDF